MEAMLQRSAMNSRKMNKRGVLMAENDHSTCGFFLIVGTRADDTWMDDD